MTNRLVARRRVLIGLGMAALGTVLGACTAAPATPAPAKSAEPAPKPTQPPAQAPTATPAPAGVATKPAAARGGTVKLLYWQAPTILNPHLATGTKDIHAARIVLEPLMTVDREGKFLPILAAEIPSLQNGGLSADGKTVTYKLKKDVKWADGQPFTAEDVVFTWQFIMNKENASSSVGVYTPLEKVEAVDPLTARLTFKEPAPAWYGPFMGTAGMVLPKHALTEFSGANVRNAPFNLKPIGTGPFMADTFKPGDSALFVRNPHYREAGKPFFDKVELKGGGDAPSAARAVFQTGEYDYAWNMLIEWNVLQDIEKGGKGVLIGAPGGGIELLMLNQTDPNAEVDGERSSLKTKHPFLSDQRVRQALALAIDRKTMAEQLYGNTGEPAANLLTTPADLASKNTSFEFSLEKANKILDDAGYKKAADGIRTTPEGKRMKVLFQTATNTLRQKQQALIKDGWQKIGVETEIKAIDSGVFFASDPGKTDTISHFYADVQMASNRATSPFPSGFMRQWYSGNPARDIPQKANNWGGPNFYRWQNDEYNKLYDAALKELDPAKSKELWVKMNDLVVNSQVAIPLVERRIVSAHSKELKGPNILPFDGETWNIGDWSK